MSIEVTRKKDTQASFLILGCMVLLVTKIQELLINVFLHKMFQAFSHGKKRIAYFGETIVPFLNK